MKEDYKVDPSKIHLDQRKKDTRREAWDRDHMPADWEKPMQKSFCMIILNSHYPIFHLMNQ